MAEEIATQHLPYPQHHRRANAEVQRAETLTPSPTAGGALIHRLQCGDVIAEVFQHDDCPGFAHTIAFQRKYEEGGQVVLSSRLTPEDMEPMRRLAKEVKSLTRSSTDRQRGMNREDWAATVLGTPSERRR